MAGFIGTFERKETKYVLNSQQTQAIKKMISEYGLSGKIQAGEISPRTSDRKSIADDICSHSASGPG